MERFLDDKKTPLLYRLIRRLVWLFAPKFRLAGTEHLPEGPCVIVGNHCQMFGPIVGELYIPGKHDVWCTSEMMEREDVAEYAYQDFWSAKPKAVRWFFRLLSQLIVPLAVLLLNSAHTIPVYHDTRIINTFRRSVDRLCDGSRIVIFPEHYEPHNNIVHDFQDKFVDLGRFYYRKTKQELSFVPMYIAPRRKQVCFGKPVRFDAAAPIGAERNRICGELMDAITEIAISLPEHIVVPYPNVPKRQYPKNIPLEVCHDEKTTI